MNNDISTKVFLNNREGGVLYIGVNGDGIPVGVSIKVAKYAGTDKVDFIENEEYGYKSLLTATYRVLDKLKIVNTSMAKITSSQRIEKNLVESVPLREAVINVIVHNDYSIKIPPLFEIFSDRIVITSYGGLLPYQSEEDFFSCSMPRNRELMRVFKDPGLVEHPGSGMGRILKYYDRSIFKISDHFIKVEFPYSEINKTIIVNNGDKAVSHNVLDNDQHVLDNDQHVLDNDQHVLDNDQHVLDNDQHVLDNDQHVLDNSKNVLENNNEIKVIELLEETPSLSASDIGKMIGISDRQVRRIIQNLRSKNKIIRVGSDRKGYRKINKERIQCLSKA